LLPELRQHPRIFTQYGDRDIKPGTSQMPVGVTVKVLDLDRIYPRFGGFSGDWIEAWEIP